jgi:hypothetical protein
MEAHEVARNIDHGFRARRRRQVVAKSETRTALVGADAFQWSETIGMQASRTLVWRRIDEPGFEIARVDSLRRANGTQIGRTYELRWRLDGARLDLEIVGVRRASVQLGDANFFDVFASPFFNSLPVMRDGLLDAAPARDYVMRFVRVPELTVVRSEQRYEPKGERVVRFSSGSFAANITFDPDGFVMRYEGFLERVS